MDIFTGAGSSKMTYRSSFHSVKNRTVNISEQFDNDSIELEYVDVGRMFEAEDCNEPAHIQTYDNLPTFKNNSENDIIDSDVRASENVSAEDSDETINNILSVNEIDSTNVSEVPGSSNDRNVETESIMDRTNWWSQMEAAEAKLQQIRRTLGEF